MRDGAQQGICLRGLFFQGDSLTPFLLPRGVTVHLSSLASTPSSIRKERGFSQVATLLTFSLTRCISRGNGEIIGGRDRGLQNMANIAGDGASGAGRRPRGDAVTRLLESGFDDVVVWWHGKWNQEPGARADL